MEEFVFFLLIVIVCVALMFLSAKLIGDGPAKSTSKATVKPQAPIKEELLLAMSDTELLRELVRLQRMSLRSQQSQTRVSRLRIFGFLALFSGGE